MRFKIKSGMHACSNTPVAVEIDDLPVNESFSLENCSTGEQTACQVEQENATNRLYLIVSDMPAETIHEYKINSDAQPSEKGVSIETKDDTLEILINGELFTVYHFGPEVVRPFF